MKLTSHKHIKNTSNVKQFSLKTNWQKDSYAAKAIRIRKGRKAIRTGPGPLGKD